MLDDQRLQAYTDLTDQVLTKTAAQNRVSAERILQIIFEYVQPKSVLDVGCGLGGWLRVARDMGIEDVRGIEGTWLDRTKIEVDESWIHLCDLESSFDLKRKFDLVMSLEVAEHLSPAAAERFVESLAAHGDLILFSAAIPHQGGAHHLNERFPEYWASLFAQRGLHVLDFIRPRIWADKSVLWWLRQNVLVFAHERALAQNAKLDAERRAGQMLSIVHPEGWLLRLGQAYRQLRELQALANYLAQGGTFTIATQADGKLAISKH